MPATVPSNTPTTVPSSTSTAAVRSLFEQVHHQQRIRRADSQMRSSCTSKLLLSRTDNRAASARTVGVTLEKPYRLGTKSRLHPASFNQISQGLLRERFDRREIDISQRCIAPNGPSPARVAVTSDHRCQAQLVQWMGFPRCAHAPSRPRNFSHRIANLCPF
jgi:hypothetical protein